MASFDPKRVTPIEWAGIGAGVAAFLFSFFPWLSAGFAFLSFSAWSSGFLAWGAVLMLVGAGAAVFLPHVGVEVKNRTMLWLGLAGAATLLVLLRLITSEGFAAIGLFLGLIAALVSTAAAFLSFQAAKRSVA
ncbi:hypothetical protein ACFPM7_27820 [Actinokineospora guangxiensis]|uniref:DUF4175 domain-containing protein n=1 Tax=Actinokineospora guangxiensis TaxID=1490288 RepID=A0ABW0EUK8_9PSEU